MCRSQRNDYDTFIQDLNNTKFYMHYYQIQYLQPTRGYGKIRTVERDPHAFVFSDEYEQNDLFALMQHLKWLKVCCVLRQ